MGSAPYRCSCLTHAISSRKPQHCSRKETNEMIPGQPEFGQGYQATFPACVSHRNQMDRSQDLISVDQLGDHFGSFIPHTRALESLTWQNTMFDENFCQPQGTASDTATFLSSNSVQHDSQAQYTSHEPMPMDLHLNNIFNVIGNSSGIDPQRNWGGWLDITDYLNHTRRETHEASPGEEVVEAPYSADNCLSLYHENPERLGLVLDPSIPFTEDNCLPGLLSLVPPPMIGPQLWDVFDNVDGNFGTEESRYLSARTGTTCMNNNAKDQTTSQIPSPDQEFTSQSLSTIPFKGDFSSGLGKASSKLLRQKIYPRILPKGNNEVVEPTSPSSTSARDIEDAESGTGDNAAPSKSRRCTRTNGFKTQRGAGRRSGPLDPAKKKRALEMRHLRACWSCRLLKVPCSKGDVCEHCRKLKSTSLAPRLCNRERLDDYSELFFPRLLSSHLRKPAIELLTYELIDGFVENDIEADLVFGHGDLPMKLVVTEFVPANRERLYVPAITSKADDQTPFFTNRHPLPVALRGKALVGLVDKCRTHIKYMVANQGDLSGLKPRKMSKLSKRLLGAVGRYHGSIRNTALLDKAMMLYCVHYFMGRTITFTSTSAKNIASRLRNPVSEPYDPHSISRLLNRQLKSDMHTILREITNDVLEELEKNLKTKSKASWALSFCVVSILCICMEEIQIAINGFGMHTRFHGAETDIPSSQDSIEVCLKLDAKPFNHVIGLFHGVYQTRKLPSANRRDKVYNPIRDGPEINFVEGLDQESADLVTEIRRIAFEHSADLTERAETPSFDSGLRSLNGHMLFRQGNSGRLVSAFLKSFEASEVRS